VSASRGAPFPIFLFHNKTANIKNLSVHNTVQGQAKITFAKAQ